MVDGMSPFQILVQVFAGVLTLGLLFWLIDKLIPKPTDNGHFDSGFTKTQDGHRLLSDVVRDDPRLGK